jgi:hypothetical protein
LINRLVGVALALRPPTGSAKLVVLGDPAALRRLPPVQHCLALFSAAQALCPLLCWLLPMRVDTADPSSRYISMVQRVDAEHRPRGCVARGASVGRCIRGHAQGTIDSLDRGDRGG